MKACVIFDTRYGNTEKVAKSLAAGLREAGTETVCLNAKEVVLDSLRQYDLLCVGAPTETFSVYRQMKEFLRTLGGIDLSGRYGFAFDTKIDSRLSGSAAKYVERELSSLGLQLIAPRESAVVTVLKEREQSRARGSRKGRRRGSGRSGRGSERSLPPRGT